MAVYTIVDEGYSVILRRSVEDVFAWVRGGNYYLDAECAVPLTKATLASALRSTGEARIYESGANDWREKVTRHG
jgi:hypothetical protein